MFKTLLSTSFASRPGGTQPDAHCRPLCAIFKAFCLLLCQDVLNQSSPCSLLADSNDCCKLTPTDCNSDWNSHVDICIYHFIIPTISVPHVIVSAYFHMCVLCWEYLIDSLVKGQYATLFPINKAHLFAILNQVIGLMSRVFANDLGDRSSIPGQVIRKTQKMVLDAASLNTQYYKVRIKSKVEKSREWSSALPYTSV